MASVAGKGQTVRSSSQTGANTIRANMQKAGASTRQINAAVKRASQLPNGRVTRL